MVSNYPESSNMTKSKHERIWVINSSEVEKMNEILFLWSSENSKSNFCLLNALT